MKVQTVDEYSQIRLHFILPLSLLGTSDATNTSDKASKNGKRSSGPKTEADKEIQRERLDGIMLRLLSQQRATKQCKTGSLDDDDDDGGPAVCQCSILLFLFSFFHFILHCFCLHIIIMLLYMRLFLCADISVNWDKPENFPTYNLLLAFLNTYRQVNTSCYATGIFSSPSSETLKYRKIYRIYSIRAW